MDIKDLKCCGNCYYERDDVKIKRCLHVGGSYGSVCDNWEYDQMTYGDRKKELVSEPK